MSIISVSGLWQKMIQVLNRHHYKDGLPAASVYVGRGHTLGNPFRRGIEAKDKDEAILLYKRWLYQGILSKDARYEALMALKHQLEQDGKLNLVCSCHPKACHADIIADAITYLQEN